MKLNLGLKTHLTVLCLLPFIFSSAATYYVANNGGNDNNNGAETSPFKTIQKAADIMLAGDICYIRAGIYRETVIPRNSGTASNPISFIAYNNEEVTISGADPVNNWSLHQGFIYVTSVTLPVNGFSDRDFFANQIFYKSGMMTEARWPNNTSDNLLKPGLQGGGVNVDGTVNAKVENADIPNIPLGWAGATVWTNEWYTSLTGTITGGTPPSLNATLSAPYSRNTYWFYLTGKLSLLDAEKEWHYDGSNNRLFFWAPGGMAPTDVEVKKRNFAFNLNDKSYIQVRDISIFASTITTSAQSRGIFINRMQAKYVSHHVTLPPLPEAFQAPGSANDLILASRCHETGIMLKGNGHTIQNSVIAYSSGNGILLEGENHTVENNFIHHANYQSSYAALIRLNGNGHKIIRNTMYDAGRDAITVDWHTNGTSSLNNEIAYNDISGFGALSSDLGGIYFASGIDLTGTRIHHNYIHDPYGYSVFWDVAGIYTDNASFNATVDHNVIGKFPITALPKSLKITSQNGRLDKIYNNTCQYGVDFESSNTIDIRNNIFYNSTSLPNVTNSSNLFSGTDPRFTNMANGDFTLLNGSPAIDRGVVIAPFTDGYIGTTPDLGAYEYGAPKWLAGADTSRIVLSLYNNNQTNPLQQHEQIALQVYPNPATNLVTVTYVLPTTLLHNQVNQHVTNIVIHNAQGKKMKVITDRSQQLGPRLLRINTQTFPKGIYFVNITTNGESLHSVGGVVSFVVH
jgi:hypothetical protein